jgi:hypothetical protein
MGTLSRARRGGWDRLERGGGGCSMWVRGKGGFDFTEGGDRGGADEDDEDDEALMQVWNVAVIFYIDL